MIVKDLLIEAEYIGKPFREYLERRLMLSKRSIIGMKKINGTLLNGEPKHVNTVLKAGDRISLVFPPAVMSDVPPEKRAIDIIYEDQYLIVINKEAGVPVHPCRNYPTGTLANGLMAHLLEREERGTIHPVTRLDKDTSGLTLFAKHPHIQYLFTIEPFKGSFKKEYRALIKGCIEPKEGIIDLPIDRLEEGKIPRGVVETGAPSVTEYKTAETYNGFSAVEIVLHTGRTHQIRVHFSHLGHPLLGDELYGGDLTSINRQALHAEKMTFMHPITGERLILKAPLPIDMERVLELACSV